MAESERMEAIRIDVPDFLYRMDRAAAMVEAAALLADHEFRKYTPSIVLDMVIAEIADLKNIVDRAACAAAGGVV